MDNTNLPLNTDKISLNLLTAKISIRRPPSARLQRQVEEIIIDSSSTGSISSFDSSILSEPTPKLVPGFPFKKNHFVKILNPKPSEPHAGLIMLHLKDS